MAEARPFGWGLVGPGRIAQRFADAVSRMDGTHLAAVQGRDAARAGAFAARWPRSDGVAVGVHDSLPALLADPAVDAVYVATPHGFHAAAVRAALEAGKPVLCEKALTPNARLSGELCALSRARGVFLMEAVWTRFLPIYAVVAGWLRSGAIGELRALQSSFCFAPPYEPGSRLWDPAQAGGALLDIGIYNLAVTQWVLRQALGACPPLAALDASGVRAPTGVDQRITATLHFDGGVASQFTCALDARSDNGFRILGERGCIVLPWRFWEATEAVLRAGDEAPVVEQRPFAINGFEGEIAEAIGCIRAGAVESPVMPHADSLEVARWMDAIHARVGVALPF